MIVKLKSVILLISFILLNGCYSTPEDAIETYDVKMVLFTVLKCRNNEGAAYISMYVDKSMDKATVSCNNGAKFTSSRSDWRDYNKVREIDLEDMVIGTAN